MDGEFDLRDTRGRLKKLALAALIGAVFTFFTVRAMMSSGHSNHDPVGASIMPLLGVFIFVLTTAFAHRIVSKKR